MRPEENIILIGYRGVGKSVVARHLARLTDKHLYSLDEVLKTRLGGNLQIYIRDNGWPAFRAAETAALKELLGTKRAVIDCGGGIVETEENIPILKQLGTVVWLSATPEKIHYRLTNTRTARLSLSGGNSAADMEEIRTVLERRNPLYRKAADIVVDTTSLESIEVAQMLLH